MSHVHTANETKYDFRVTSLIHCEFQEFVGIELCQKFAFRVHKHMEKRRLTSFIEVFEGR